MLVELLNLTRVKVLSILYPVRFLIGKHIKIYSKPELIINRGCRLIIGDNVTLNSYAKTYHVGMYGPVKIFADRPGATIKIGSFTRIHGSTIHAYKSIQIGSRCLIAANCQIFDGNGHSISFDNVDERIHTIGGAKEVVIEDSVWIGANSIIMPGVRIGYGSIVSAGSVVYIDIPPMTIARGNPAEILTKNIKDVK